jgi:hypothetical protein
MARTPRNYDLLSSIEELQRDELSLPGKGFSTAWVPVTFSPNWKNYESVTFQKCAYRRGSDGRVTIRGLAQPVAAGQNVLFTLPVGFRPALQQGFACAGGNGAGNICFRVDVRADGSVYPELAFGGATSAFYLFLDSISFFPG